METLSARRHVDSEKPVSRPLTIVPSAKRIAEFSVHVIVIFPRTVHVCDVSGRPKFLSIRAHEISRALWEKHSFMNKITSLAYDGVIRESRMFRGRIRETPGKSGALVGNRKKDVRKRERRKRSASSDFRLHQSLLSSFKAKRSRFPVKPREIAPLANFVRDSHSLDSTAHPEYARCTHPTIIIIDTRQAQELRARKYDDHLHFTDWRASNTYLDSSTPQGDPKNTYLNTDRPEARQI